MAGNRLVSLVIPTSAAAYIINYRLLQTWKKMRAINQSDDNDIYSNLNFVVHISMTCWIVADDHGRQMWWSMSLVFPFYDVFFELLSDLFGDRHTVDYSCSFFNTT